ncbi:MAG: MBL fold metallo-hydrolase [Lachnospiraceae bacterium]|jgi:glyoxylase-like metal-dependent hydrolase (beta-lactamase superfamily II)|nr:MBL fold metallo-hydrolase [Lachnospiraceae bacterium]
MKYQITALAPDLWAIEENMVRCFLLHGEKGTLLIDACASGGSEFREAIDSITGGAPMQIALTHSDRDHTAGLIPSDTVWVNPAELEHLGAHDFTVEPLHDGTILSAGNRTVKAILLPGHTPGNMVFADEEQKVMFIGDSISSAQVFLFGNGRNLPLYIQSLERLEEEFPGYRYYACHGEVLVGESQLNAQLACAKKVLAGELEGDNPPHPMPCKLYRYGGAALLY